MFDYCDRMMIVMLKYSVDCHFDCQSIKNSFLKCIMLKSAEVSSFLEIEIAALVKLNYEVILDKKLLTLLSYMFE